MPSPRGRPKAKGAPRCRAREAGDRYYDGTPCINCGETLRFVSNGTCTLCSYLRTKAIDDRRYSSGESRALNPDTGRYEWVRKSPGDKRYACSKLHPEYGKRKRSTPLPTAAQPSTLSEQEKPRRVSPSDVMAEALSSGFRNRFAIGTSPDARADGSTSGSRSGSRDKGG